MELVYKLSRLSDLCKALGVGYSLVFCEGDDSYYVAVDNWVGKSTTLILAIDNAISWLEER